MSTSETGQITGDAAEVYEAFFVPALFQPWTAFVTEAAGIQSGQRVLDVACRTGVLARAVAERTGAAGTVVGIDLNVGMLAVARRQAPAIDWKQGRAEALPFDSASFDAVVSQFGLMFFADQRVALREMVRVLRPGGRMAVAVWDTLERIEGYAAMTALLQRLFGSNVADALRAPFVLGDTAQLRHLCAEAGIPHAHIRTYECPARFPSLQAWIYTDIRGWTLADVLNDAQYAQLLHEAETELREFVTAEGAIEFTCSAHIVTATNAS